MGFEFRDSSFGCGTVVGCENGPMRGELAPDRGSLSADSACSRSSGECERWIWVSIRFNTTLRIRLLSMLYTYM